MSNQHSKSEFSGRILTPSDADYDRLRRGWNLNIDQRPAAIMLPETAQDVAHGIDHARKDGMPVAAQSTGHGVHRPADGALLIVTSGLNAFQIDPEERTVRAGAGLVWEPIVNAAAAHGLAPLIGTSPHVGIVGYTLGGGIGWLARKYGLARDSVREIELVTADGEIRHASAAENPDLFWAMRSSRGGLGIVTALTLNLVPVASLYGGSLTYAGELATEALRFFRDWSQTVPDELTSKFSIFKYPSFPFVPEHLRGKVEIHVRAAYVGSAEDGARWMQPWLDWQAPLSNTFAQMPFTDVETINADSVAPAAVYPSSEMLDALPDEAIGILVRGMTDPASPIALADLRHAGGAMKSQNTDGLHDGEYYLVLGGPTPSAESREKIQAAIAHLSRELQPYLTGGIYPNFMLGDEASRRIQDVYTPEAYAKLSALKAQYDPDNLFRFGYALAGAPQLANPA
jgi:UDP-N-acetylenolpyruvoylglucosamine reductase